MVNINDIQLQDKIGTILSELRDGDFSDMSEDDLDALLTVKAMDIIKLVRGTE